ncbi:MAG TPA: CaiB/BaiF CoA-transferase family protein [Candidatus Sulfomarinibacteraceae bacterium]|nr:CaiB/BaiF CoA-transferase family protein [Candidatus Sulfomarinibacteraceae bacterium]
MADPKTLPLEGLRVLDFTHNVMGPTTGMLLGDLGADVIHVEPPAGDATRRLRGFGSGYFAFYSRNKRSLAVDLKADEGRAIVMKLVEGTDVVVENFGPGTMDRLGYGYEHLRAVKPDLIYCSLKGFLSGPYEHRAAMDEVVQMMSGLAYMTGEPGKPMRAGTSIIDMGGGMFGLIGILTALYTRALTGEGTFLKTSLFETAAFFMGQHMAYGALTDEPVPPMPARVSAWSIYRVFECTDGPIFIGIISEKHWRAFCEAFDRDDWLADPRLGSNNDRISERHWLHDAVAEMIAGFPRAEVTARLDAAGVPFSPIARPEDLYDDPQLNQGLGLLETVLPAGVTTKLPRIPLEMDAYDFRLRRNPPQIGEDTAALLDELGYDADEIGKLVDEGVVAVKG